MKLSIIGHMYVNEENRETFDYLLEEYDIEFIVPKFWTGEFGEIYYRADGFSKISIPLLTNNYIPLLKDLETDILWIDEELVHVQNYFILKKYSNIKKIIIRTAQNIEKHSMYRDFMYKYVDKHVNKIVAVGKTSADTAKNIFKRDIDIVPLSIYERFYTLERNREYFEDKLHIGFCGRISKEKGIYWLMEILKSIKIDFKFIFAGIGPLITKLLVFLEENNIDFEYMGIVPQRDMIHFYSNIDILLNTSIKTKSWTEQQGRNVLEAAASRTFVISSLSGELIYTLKNIGMNVEENNTKEVIDIIESIYRNKELFFDNIEKSFESAKKFNKYNIGRKIMDVINE